MIKFKVATLLAATLLAIGQAHAAPVTDTVQAPTGFFTPTDAQKLDTPYYRGKDEDWGWTHGAIAGPITTATLNISAFDVDAPPQVGFIGEIDNVYAYDDGVKTLIGQLAGANNIFSFTSFVLGHNFDNDINAGLKVFIDIDTTGEGWFVSLAKSSLSVDGGILPPPVPGAPEPETYVMMLGGLATLGFVARRRKQK